MDEIDRIAVEVSKSHIVTSAECHLVANKDTEKLSFGGYDVPECASYVPPVPKTPNETPNVPVIHSDECSRSKPSGSVCTCGAGAKCGTGLTYAVVEKSNYDQQFEKKKPNRVACPCCLYYYTEEKEKDGESAIEPPADNKNQRRSPIWYDPVCDCDEFKKWLGKKDEEEEKPSREKMGGGKKKVSFSDGYGGDDIEKLSNYYEMEPEPEPTCEKPYCPLLYQVIILAVLILSLSLMVAFHTVHEFTHHQKRHTLPVNITVFHNSLNY